MGMRAFLRVHLVLGVGTTEVTFGGFVEAVSVVLEQVGELQKLMLSIFDISRLAGLEAGLKGGVDLRWDAGWLTKHAERTSERDEPSQSPRRGCT